MTFFPLNIMIFPPRNGLIIRISCEEISNRKNQLNFLVLWETPESVCFPPKNLEITPDFV
jgi:hypothetical protein